MDRNCVSAHTVENAQAIRGKNLPGQSGKADPAISPSKHRTSTGSESSSGEPLPDANGHQRVSLRRLETCRAKQASPKQGGSKLSKLPHSKAPFWSAQASFAFRRGSLI